MRIGVIIAAAGKSSRFGEGDKLSQDLGGRAVLLRTVEAFTKRSEVVSIIVAGPPHELDDFRLRFGPALGFNGARIVAGGTIERWESIESSLPPASRARLSLASPCATRSSASPRSRSLPPKTM